MGVNLPGCCGTILLTFLYVEGGSILMYENEMQNHIGHQPLRPLDALAKIGKITKLATHKSIPFLHLCPCTVMQMVLPGDNIYLTTA